jgi:hypothetical protein
VVAIAKAAAVAGGTDTNAESTEGTGTEPISNRAGAVEQTSTQPQVTEKRKAEEMGDGMEVDATSGLAVSQEQAEAADRAVKQLKVDLD